MKVWERRAVNWKQDTNIFWHCLLHYNFLTTETDLVCNLGAPQKTPTEDLLMISQLVLNKHSGKSSKETSRPLSRVLKEYLPGVYFLHIYPITQIKWTQQILWGLFFSFSKNIFWSTILATATEATKKTTFH